MEIIPNGSFEDNTKRGFTLVEVLTVILLLSLLIVIAIPAYKAVLERGKKKNYEAKVSLIEMAAEKYAVEENLMNTTTVTLNELITSGYVAADKVDKDGNYEILNEVSGEDMNCYTVTIQFNNDLPSAKLNDTKTCNLIDQESGSELVQIKAYKMTTSGYTEIAYNAKDKAYDWSNEDILLLVSLKTPDPSNEIQVKYAENFKDLTGADVKIKWIGKNVTENGPDIANDYNEVTSENVANYKNAIIINAAAFQKQEYQVELEQGDLIINGRTVIRIDKEAPTAKAAVATTWENGGQDCSADNLETCTKAITIKTADQNGSGPNKTCISTKDNGQDKVCQSHYEDNKYIGSKVTFNKPAGTYYVYTEDNAGNISDEPVDSVYVTNIDTTNPTIVYNYETTKVDTDDGSDTFPIVIATCSDSTAERESGTNLMTLETEYYNEDEKIWVVDNNDKNEYEINPANGQIIGTAYIQNSQHLKQRISAKCLDESGNTTKQTSAEFELKDIKVTFNGNGAKVINNSLNEVDSLDKHCITYDNNKCQINEPTIIRTGYNIIGWNSSASATTSSYSNQLDSNATYYAITSIINIDPEITKVTIAYNNIADGVSGTMPSPQEINAGSSFTLNKNVYVRAGHHFHGWSAHRDGKIFCNDLQWKTSCGDNNESAMLFKDQYTFNNINYLATDGTITFYITWEDHKYEDRMWWSYDSAAKENKLVTRNMYLTKYIGGTVVGQPSCGNKHGFTGWVFHYKYERVYYRKCTVCGEVDYTYFWCPCDDGDKLTGCYLF